MGFNTLDVVFLTCLYTAGLIGIVFVFDFLQAISIILFVLGITGLLLALIDNKLIHKQNKSKTKQRGKK